MAGNTANLIEVCGRPPLKKKKKKQSAAAPPARRRRPVTPPPPPFVKPLHLPPFSATPCAAAPMSAKPEWEVLADLALRRLEKDYERTLQAKPIVRFKQGDVVSLAGMSTPLLEGAKGTVVGPMDPVSLRYPVQLSSPEVRRLQPALPHEQPAAHHQNQRALFLITSFIGRRVAVSQWRQVPAGSSCNQLRLQPCPPLTAAPGVPPPPPPPVLPCHAL